MLNEELFKKRRQTLVAVMNEAGLGPAELAKKRYPEESQEKERRTTEKLLHNMRMRAGTNGPVNRRVNLVEIQWLAPLLNTTVNRLTCGKTTPEEGGQKSARPAAPSPEAGAALDARTEVAKERRANIRRLLKRKNLTQAAVAREMTSDLNGARSQRVQISRTLRRRKPTFPGLDLCRKLEQHFNLAENEIAVRVLEGEGSPRKKNVRPPSAKAVARRSESPEVAAVPPSHTRKFLVKLGELGVEKEVDGTLYMEGDKVMAKISFDVEVNPLAVVRDLLKS